MIVDVCADYISLMIERFCGRRVLTAILCGLIRSMQVVVSVLIIWIARHDGPLTKADNLLEQRKL